MSGEQEPKSVVVVGAGLAGAMVTLLLAQKNKSQHFRILEYRPDFRTTDFDTSNRIRHTIKRSINLALSYRGICALKEVGLFDRLKEFLIPMKGRIIHKVAFGGVEEQAYGIGDQAIYSISRSMLNKILLDELDLLPNVRLDFEVKLNKIDKDGVITCTDVRNNNDNLVIKPAFVIGADGAYSNLRASLQRLTRVDYSIEYIKHGYKELCIPCGEDGEFKMNPWRGLHIWPRHDFMMIALPNPDKTFTVTLFAPFDGPDGFDSIHTDEEILNYFKKYFPDVIPLIPNVVEEFKQSPTSALLSVKTDPWHYQDKLVLIGDAAHAACPFFGQGMNAAFEDGLIFAELYEKYNGDASVVLPTFSKVRVEAGHALVDLSKQNYIEMRSHTANPLFVAKQYIEKGLHKVFGSYYVPKYTMVAFSRTPYHEAVARAKFQSKLLNAALYTTVALTALTTFSLFTKSSNNNNSTNSKNPQPSIRDNALSTIRDLSDNVRGSVSQISNSLFSVFGK